ncbi:hypothetical protein FN846DRAFT_1013396 [Sphaerosporella brunnea]|uniref:Uncharacterized protein n=1 Tax=Sphaerosporella brunnea TaxID=1250544 RepID=A0A5J5EXV0_9PEZI|nr:hypothetical protein FN846DRAFT_1013396 [Sphaerosporella brunnea]
MHQLFLLLLLFFRGQLATARPVEYLVKTIVTTDSVFPFGFELTVYAERFPEKATATPTSTTATHTATNTVESKFTILKRGTVTADSGDDTNINPFPNGLTSAPVITVHAGATALTHFGKRAVPTNRLFQAYADEMLEKEKREPKGALRWGLGIFNMLELDGAGKVFVVAPPGTATKVDGNKKIDMVRRQEDEELELVVVEPVPVGNGEGMEEVPGIIDEVVPSKTIGSEEKGTGMTQTTTTNTETPLFSKLPVWTPDVIATSLALIPVILAITVVCVLLLFLILHACTPREIHHVTNNTYTTRVVKRPREPHGPNEKATARGETTIATTGLAADSPTPNPTSSGQQQTDGITDVVTDGCHEIISSGAFYMPRYPRQTGMAPSDTNITDNKKWHNGLLDLGSKRNSPRLNSAKFFRSFVPSSLKGDSGSHESAINSRMDTDYVLSQASRRLESVPPAPDDRSLSPIAESCGGDGVSVSVPQPRRERAMTVLPDTEFGRETLRDRRKGMRDSWLDGLFAVRAPGTENLVILEQRDGALRGASVGGAVVPESVPVTDYSSSPRKAEDVLGTDNAAADRRPKETPILRSVPRHYGEEVTPEIIKVRSSGNLTIHEATASPVSGDGYEASQSDLNHTDQGNKENVSTTVFASAKCNSVQFATPIAKHDHPGLRIPSGIDLATNQQPRSSFDTENFKDKNAMLQQMVEDQADEDALRLHLVPSLDGGANTPFPPWKSTAELSAKTEAGSWID